MKPYILLLLVIPVQAQVTCDLCMDVVRSGIKQDGRYYHGDCFRKSRRCMRCEKPVTGTGTRLDDGWLHSACFRSARKCALCPKPILKGRYLEAENGTSYHKTCYEQAVHCGLCQLPTTKGDAVQTKQEAFHQKCWDTATLCHICEIPIRGVYYQDFYDRTSCAIHHGEAQCHVCQSPDVAWKLRDGRHQCKRCEDQAVYDGPEVKPMVLALKAFLQEQGLEIKHHLDISLLGRQDLAAQKGGEGHPLLVGLFHIEPLPAQRRDRRTISVLYGLPKPQFEAVMVHELTHAWQAEACVPDQSLELKEGVAELMAWLYLSRNGPNRWVKTVEAKSVEPYRSGFEKARDLYLKLGHQAFFKAVREMKSFEQISQKVAANKN